MNKDSEDPTQPANTPGSRAGVVARFDKNEFARLPRTEWQKRGFDRAKDPFRLERLLIASVDRHDHWWLVQEIAEEAAAGSAPLGATARNVEGSAGVVMWPSVGKRFRKAITTEVQAAFGYGPPPRPGESYAELRARYEQLGQSRRKARPRSVGPRGEKRERDSQRSRVYGAEREAWRAISVAPLDGTVVDAQNFVDEVTASRAWSDIAGRSWMRDMPELDHDYRTITVRSRTSRARGSNAACHIVYVAGRWQPPTINLSNEHATSRWVVLHELAHQACESHVMHGPAFCTAYLRLVWQFIGLEAYLALRSAFVTNGVKFDAVEITDAIGTAVCAYSRMVIRGSDCGVVMRADDDAIVLQSSPGTELAIPFEALGRILAAQRFGDGGYRIYDDQRLAIDGSAPTWREACGLSF